MGLLLFIASIIYVICVFSKAQECYLCGSRKVSKRSKFGTRALCNECITCASSQ